MCQITRVQVFQSEVLHQASFDSSYQASIRMLNSSIVHQAILQVEQKDRHMGPIVITRLYKELLNSQNFL